MPDRDLDITKFSYKSYRKLKTSLGEFDAVVECNELAIREFIQNFTKDGKKYITQLSQKHHVKVNEVGIDKFSSRIRSYYIASVFQQSEQFLSDFKKEWKEYFPEKEWADKEKSQTALDSTLKSICLSLDSDILCFYEYYRLVRNYMSHTDRDTKDLHNKWKEIHANENKFLSSLNLPLLPHQINSLDFDDFIIITNIVKHIAFLICQQSKPTNEQIATVIFKKINTNKNTLAGIKKLKNDPERYKKAIRSCIMTEYGRFSTSDADEVTSFLICLLA